MSTSAPRRPSRLGRRLLIALLVVVVLLVVADRIADAVAEHEAATLLQRSQNLAHRPDVSVTGFPFLTQLVSGDFDEIDVRADDLMVGDGNRQLRVRRLDVAMHDVHVARDFRSATSKSSTATAKIRYSDVAGTLGVTLAYAGDHRVRATHTVTLAGVSVPASATAGVHLSDSGELTFVDPKVTVAGQSVPTEVSSYFSGVFGTAIPLRGLPFGVQVRSLSAGPDGLTVRLTAQQLTFRR
jgi:DUF2993 family protein